MDVTELMIWVIIAAFLIITPIWVWKNPRKLVPYSVIVTRCPHCKSALAVTSQPELTGGEGLLVSEAAGDMKIVIGNIGNKKAALDCLSCGRQWDNDGPAALADRERQKDEYMARKGKAVNPKQLFLPRSQYRAIMVEMLGKCQTQSEVIDNMKAFGNDLAKQKITVLSDYEFKRVMKK